MKKAKLIVNRISTAVMLVCILALIGIAGSVETDRMTVSEAVGYLITILSVVAVALFTKTVTDELHY